MQVKLLLVTFYLNGGLHVVSVGKPSERMLNFLTIRFLKTDRIRTEFQFSAHPYQQRTETNNSKFSGGGGHGGNFSWGGNIWDISGGGIMFMGIVFDGRIVFHGRGKHLILRNRYCSLSASMMIFDEEAQ